MNNKYFIAYSVCLSHIISAVYIIVFDGLLNSSEEKYRQHHIHNFRHVILLDIFLTE